MAIVLIGFMGAGKSTAARELGAALGAEALDSDELLAERFGHPVAEEFAERGEAAFRAAEEQVVLELLDGNDIRMLSVTYAGGRLYATWATQVLDGSGHSAVSATHAVAQAPTPRR